MGGQHKTMRPLQTGVEAASVYMVFLLVLVAGPVELVAAQVGAGGCYCCSSVNGVQGYDGEWGDTGVTLANQR